jgi:hypothetical protein
MESLPSRIPFQSKSDRALSMGTAVRTPTTNDDETKLLHRNLITIVVALLSVTK